MTTSITTLTETILDFLDTQWAGRTAIAAPNRPYSGSGDYIAPTLLPVLTQRNHMTGNPLTGHEERGLLIVQVFVKKGKGDEDINNHLDTLDGIFREQITSGIVFLVPQIVPADFADQTWYQKNFTVEYFKQN